MMINICFKFHTYYIQLLRCTYGYLEDQKMIQNERERKRYILSDEMKKMKYYDARLKPGKY